MKERGGREGPVEVRVRTRAGSAGGVGGLGRFDVVLVGQVLSELDVALDDDVRRKRHVELLRTLLADQVDEGGALVVVEPALPRPGNPPSSSGSRRASASEGATIFAPCLHAAPCPALARESDWCHEDLAVDLPPWLVPVAKAAGLRHEGLTFSYLVLHRGARRLVDAVPAPPGAARLRVVSEEIRTKGKREAFVGGELAGSTGPVAARVRLMRLDRDANPNNAAWERLRRGDVAVVHPSPELERPRIPATGTRGTGPSGCIV